MIIHAASQLLTIAGPPQRGHSLGQLGIIEDGAVLIRGDTILEIGSSKTLLKTHPDEPLFDAAGCVVMPGFVDPHTHLPWSGDRANEFELRLLGKNYLEIMADGGGINSTVNSTRIAKTEKLLSESRQRAMSIFRSGTTTAETKSGYGLTPESELRLLQVMVSLNHEGPLELIPTFLGAHAIPAEFNNRADEYIQVICNKMLPMIAKWWKENQPDQPLPFVDVFCDRGAFTYSQSERVFKTACSFGFPLKIHADEFENLGGTHLATEYKATSADHLVKTSSEEIRAIASSDTVAVSLPCTPFGLGTSEYTPAQEILAANGILALASDLNPGTAWCGNMQFVIALACRQMKLTPAQAVVAATINAAAAIKRSDRIGSLEPGKQSDLIVLSVADYRQLAYRFGGNLVNYVIKKGQIYPN